MKDTVVSRAIKHDRDIPELFDFPTKNVNQSHVKQKLCPQGALTPQAPDTVNEGLFNKPVMEIKC